MEYGGVPLNIRWGCGENRDWHYANVFQGLRHLAGGEDRHEFPTTKFKPIGIGIRKIRNHIQNHFILLFLIIHEQGTSQRQKGVAGKIPVCRIVKNARIIIAVGYGEPPRTVLANNGRLLGEENATFTCLGCPRLFMSNA